MKNPKERFALFFAIKIYIYNIINVLNVGSGLAIMSKK